MKNSFYSMLSESLINKYSRHLTEAWSSSMPKWLKRIFDKDANVLNSNTEKAINSRLGQSIIGNRTSSLLGAIDDAVNAYNSNYKNYPNNYTFADSGKLASKIIDEDNQSLFLKFAYQLQIDLTNSSSKFIEGDFPKSNKDPRLQYPNIGIWYIPGLSPEFDDAYAKGLNDTQKLVRCKYMDRLPEKLQNRPFGRLSLKQLAEISEGFCYINIDEAPKTSIQNKKDERAHNKAALRRAYDSGQERVTKGNLGQLARQINTHRMDKSGYLAIPSCDKYYDKLKDAKLFKQAKNLQHVEDQIKDMFNQYQEAMQSYDIFTVNEDQVENSELAIKYIQRAANSYKLCLQDVQTAQSHSSDVTDFKIYLNGTRFENRLDECNSYLQRAKLALDDISVIEFDI